MITTAACGDSPPTGVDPDTAPVASVDRFQDDFGKLFKRSAPVFNPSVVKPIVPAPNAPIDFDALFTVRALGPAGTPVTYYSFDILPRQPSTAYLVMRDGAPLVDQLPIITGLPGDAGYNDFVRITEVSVTGEYVANQFVSEADIEAAVADGSATLVPTTRIANWAAVPAGSTATKRFDGEVVTGHRSWFEGQVVHQMRFEENLTVTADGTVPTAEIIVIFDNNMNPSNGFATQADGMTHNAIDTLAGGPGYSSLWNHSVGNKENFASVVDFTSALANVMAANVGVDVNCPEVR
ncbi:MAG: hypothetical protein H0X17_23485 [Deltaproteobacteria bacterium]|nr:hypothetical protein [Deltaproteobacteria bacterium]